MTGLKNKYAVVLVVGRTKLVTNATLGNTEFKRGVPHILDYDEISEMMWGISKHFLNTGNKSAFPFNPMRGKTPQLEIIEICKKNISRLKQYKDSKILQDFCNISKNSSISNSRKSKKKKNRSKKKPSTKIVVKNKVVENKPVKVETIDKPNTE